MFRAVPLLILCTVYRKRPFPVTKRPRLPNERFCTPRERFKRRGERYPTQGRFALDSAPPTRPVGGLLPGGFTGLPRYPKHSQAEGNRRATLADSSGPT